MTRATLLILILALLGSEVLGEESKTCYDCGYMCKNLQAGECVPEPITEDGSIHFCKDTATMASMTKQCTGSDECCGSLVEYVEIKHEDTGEVTIDKIAYHGCEKDLAPAIGNHEEVVCGEHTNACYNVSREDIHADYVERAEACFCEGDLCNNNTPDLPEPEPAPTNGPGQGHKCYNCGYKCTNIVGNVCKPEPLGPDAPFCGDVAGMGSMTKECAGAETECCGSLKEFFEVKNEESGETHIDMFAFHGCEGDLEHALSVQVEVLCSEHKNTCYNVSRDTIDDTEIIRAEACFCDGDLCNDNLPTLPDPEPTDAGPTKTCYNCGYKCTDMHSSTCTPEPIDTEGKVPFCGDSASMGSSTKQCGGTDECCGVLRVYYELQVNGTDRTDMLTFHGCEKDLAGAVNSHVEVICSDHANSCFNVSTDNIQDEFLTEAEACFCDGDLCNKDIPDLPFPPPLPTDKPTDGPPPCPECTKCYNCGYKQDGLDGEMGEIVDVPFCNDFATEDTVVSCGKDDCCGMLKEYFIKTDADGNNSTEIIGRHGCAADIDHLGHYSATCEKNGDSCWEVEDASLDHDHDDGHTIFQAEICLCGQDRCNDADPVPEIPTTTVAPGSSASQVASALLTLLLSLCLQI